MISDDVKSKVIQLRQDGLTYGQIVNETGVAKEFHISYARLSKIERFQRTKTKSGYDSVKDNRHRRY